MVRFFDVYLIKYFWFLDLFYDGDRNQAYGIKKIWFFIIISFHMLLKHQFMFKEIPQPI